MRQIYFIMLAGLQLACGDAVSDQGIKDVSQTTEIADQASETVDAGQDGVGTEDLVLPDVETNDLVPDGVPLDVVEGDPVPLVEDGASNHVIVLQEGYSPSEYTAATELQFHIEACTGAQILFAEEVPEEGTPMIVLGMGPVAESLGVAPTAEELGEQGFYTKTVPPHIVIAGTKAAGTMYGVHRFLEQHLGVRWYAPGVVRTPNRAEVVIPPLDRLVKPAFLWRHTSYKWPGGEEDFRTRQGDNSGSGLEDHEWGTQHYHDGRAHSYFWYVSPDEFFDEHPEYFSEIGGVRQREETQLCLTNPDVLDIVTKRMLQRMVDKPHARQHNFSQKDRYNYCTCDACNAMNEKYGTTGGTQFWFVNELAKRTVPEYPDKLIGTLAYMYTEEPPVGLEMHDNTAVWLCHMYPSCDSHPIATCPNNADYKRRAEAWAEISKHLYIWHYIVDFTHYYNPFPNFRAMAEDARFYRDIGVEGIYLQGMGHSGGGGEFSLLRPYYGMKLLWNPDLDPLAIRKDFLEGYYGAAAPHIESYIEMLLDEVTDKDIHMHLYTNPGQGYFSNEMLSAAEAHFDEAQEAIAGDEEVLERVKIARMPLTYARVFPRNGYEVVDDKLEWGQPIAGAMEIKEFMDRMAVHGFTTLREVGGSIELLALVYSIVATPLPLKVLDNGLLRVEVVPSLGGRALRVIHKASGKSVTASNTIPNLFFPFAGGLEDRIGGQLEAYGWVEPTTASEQTDLSVTVSSSTLNNYALKRTFTLEPDTAVLHQETTLTNNTGGLREDQFRFHMELNLGNLEQTRVQFTSLAGEAIDKDMTAIIEGQREGEHYYADNAPDGSWTLSGTDGLAVTQSWAPAAFNYTWLYAYPAVLNELEVELWAPKLSLKNGESVTFSHAIEVSEK